MSKKTFKNLTEEDKEFIVKYYSEIDPKYPTYELKRTFLAEKFGVSQRSISNWFKQLGLSTPNSQQILQTSPQYKLAMRKTYKKRKFYILTYEQAHTPLHEPFFQNILAYKEFLNAELGVILGTYRNPTSIYPDAKEEHWNNATSPYWDAGKHQIHKYLSVIGSLKVRPTAKMPLQGLEDMGGQSSFIIGHPKLQLKAGSVLPNHPKKIMMTTGAVTLPNYTRSKAGAAGEEQHKYGFVIVEIRDNEIFHIRQVEADDDGTFHDLIHKVKDGIISRVEKLNALVWGDIHHRFLDPRVEIETFNFLKKVPVDYTVYHDLIDADSVNHWESKDPIKAYQRAMEGRDILKTEIDETLDWLTKTLPYNPIVVRSNHDMWLERWITDMDWKKDIRNGLEYMEYATVLMKGEATKGILPYVINKRFGDKVISLDLDESFIINGYEVGHHGYHGQNGSKGNITQFKRMNTPVVVGDYHTPSRYDKALGVGTSTLLQMGYNKGPSNWLQAHVILHTNKTAQHLIFVEGNFTTFKY